MLMGSTVKLRDILPLQVRPQYDLTNKSIISKRHLDNAPKCVERFIGMFNKGLMRIAYPGPLR